LAIATESPAAANDRRWAFTGLQSLTFVHTPSRHGSSSLQLAGLHRDITLKEVEGNKGEFQVWEINYDGTIAPWKLLLGEVTWELAVNIWWEDIEVNNSKGRSSLNSVRFVNSSRLYGYPEWSQRSKFLSSKLYVQQTGWLYATPKFDTLEELLAMKLYDWDSYEELSFRSGDPFRPYYGRRYDIDPLALYLSKAACVCDSGHDQTANFYSEEEMEDWYLEGELQYILKEKERRS
jgi:hypothetical protein